MLPIPQSHKGLYGFLSPEMLSRNDPVQKELSMLEFRKLQVSLSVRNLPDGYIYLISHNLYRPLII